MFGISFGVGGFGLGFQGQFRVLGRRELGVKPRSEMVRLAVWDSEHGRKELPYSRKTPKLQRADHSDGLYSSSMFPSEGVGLRRLGAADLAAKRGLFFRDQL